MKNIVILALLGEISAIELKSLAKSGFWPTEFETLYDGINPREEYSSLA